MTKQIFEELLVHPMSISIGDVSLFGAITDIQCDVGVEKDFRLRLSPKNSEAAVIEVIRDSKWFGLTAGKFMFLDLEDLEDGDKGSYALCVSLVKAIMQGGMTETGLVYEDDALEWHCSIPVLDGEYTCQRSRAFTRRKRKAAVTESLQYEPFAK